MLFANVISVRAASPTPLVRDVTTGYLLNCFFMSPQPYCWPTNREVMLSGWETDRSGGYFAYHPTCIYPEGFGFHSDWFKLVDTNRHGAITLKHQIARQTEGRLTLEFRFMFPARMDGACWQLRDLEQAGVSLITADGNLCMEARNGKPVPLAPVRDGREYGVKVVADLAAKTASVFVDGALKASSAPFAHPVRTIDYFLAKTGDAATGEMFLNPVNIHKGYAVNESFVACGTGEMPDDWTAESGTARVEQFECGTKLDIFSLRLNGSAIKRFAPMKNKTVIECRFLLPAKKEGWRVELSSRGKTVFVLDTIKDCRSNLWYMAKIIADPATGTADVFINGKPAAKGASFRNKVRMLDMIRFAGDLWVDDVLVYPWRDWPSDYVPEPKPAVAKDGYMPGVQSCNLWREGTSYAGWDYVYPYRDKRKPYLGWYDEGNPEETDWEIKWQVEHGIAFEQHCWYRPNNTINHPIKDGVLDQSIIKGLFNARYSSLKKFTIMCTDDGACESNPEDFKDNIIPYWIEYFFKDPRYFKIDGKPVLSIYHYANWIRMFGGAEGGRAAIRLLREEVFRAGFPGLILMMEERSGDENALRAIKALGADYCYSYTWFSQDPKFQYDRMTRERELCRAVGLGLLPSISMGWDREAWGVHDGGWLSFPDYKNLALWTRDEYMPSLPADSLGRRIVMLANWCEFGEGHFMLPNASGGFGYLDALRDVFAQGGPHQDVVPTERQKRRFTVLYPKD